MRRWWRGSHNSCSRSDLEFLPLPNSKLARKRRGEPANPSGGNEKTRAPSVIVKDERRDDRETEKVILSTFNTNVLLVDGDLYNDMTKNYLC
jgi:hypothetical protein